MDDPHVVIGGKLFLVPEFPIWAQRKVTPLLAHASSLKNVQDPDVFGELIDIMFTCLTTVTKDGKPPVDGAPRNLVNDISKEDFECLRVKALDFVTEVLPLLLVQAGLKKADAPLMYRPGKEGSDGTPQTPLPGENTSTTSSPT